jgi:hypothetical protein
MNELGSSKPVSKANSTQYSARPVQETKTGVMRHPAIFQWPFQVALSHVYRSH